MPSPLSILPLALLLACAPQGPPAPGKRVILISLDTLRADHLSLYGYERETSPNLARLARSDAAVFENCYSQASWTLPSHMSIFTGLYPELHGVVDKGKRLAAEVVTLTEALHAAGLATTAFTDGAYVARGYGLEDGFDEYFDDPTTQSAGQRGLQKKLPFVEDWLRIHRDSSFFLFLHTYDVHAPYDVGEPWLSAFAPQVPADSESVAQLEYLRGLGESEPYELERFESLDQVIATYDGMILWADHVVGRLCELLEELGIYDETLIVITSDHGESFLDRGLYAGHGLFLNEAETHVPLIVKFPGNRFAGRRSAAMVESIDILPTVLAALGLQPEPDQILQGFDLAQLLDGAPDPSPLAFSFGGELQVSAVRSADWTLLEGVPDELVDRRVATRLRAEDFAAARARASGESRLVPTGPGPHANAIDSRPEVLERLERALTLWKMAQYSLRALVGSAARRRELSAQELNSLRKLGYL